MSDGSDDNDVEQVAHEYVQRHGLDSPSILRDFAEAADAIGDILSAEACVERPLLTQRSQCSIHVYDR